MTDVKLLLLHSNTWNHLTVYKQMNNPIYQPLRSGRIWHKVNF